jgi:outer membrane protein assembly factor BamB/tetratricopeptide (TPR) repeat protein
MPSAEQFLAVLEEKDILPPEVLGALRRTVRETAKPPAAQALADWLVRHGHLTPSMAERLLAEGHPEGTRRKAEGGGTASPRTDHTAVPTGHQPPATSHQPLPGGFGLLDELPPLGAAGGGPLDTLLAAGTIDEAQGPGLGPARRRRWSLRRFAKGLRRFFREPRRSIRNWFRRRSQVVQVKPADPRKVKLLLFSWGLAVALMATAFGVFWYLSPPSPGELVRRADVAYDDGKYAEAIECWNIYLNKYAYEPRAAEVRVRRSLAELREAVEEARAADDWTAAFEMAQSLMKKLPDEPAYEDWQKEVGEVLGMIGEGLARQAAQQPTAAVVEQARFVVGMIEMNVGESLRPDQEIAEIQRLLEGSEREVNRGRDLEETLAAVAAALEAKDAVAAYAARNTLVARHPDLAEDGRLEEALGPAAALLAQAVKMVPRAVRAATGEQSAGILASRAMAVRTVQGEVPGVKGRSVFAATAGVAYGLDAASGRLLWRRFIAAEKGAGPVSAKPRPAFPPQPLGDDPAGDLLLTDPVHNEVLRVQGATGRLVWRQAIGRRIAAAPVRAGNRLLVPTEQGQLVLVDLATGASPGHVQLPQPLGVSPTVDPQRSLVFQVADQSTLYVFSQDDWACRQVFHLGQQRDAVAAPPVIAGGYLLIVENQGPGPGSAWYPATLRVLGMAEKGELKFLQHVRLKGRVTTAPLVHGQRVAVLTVQGTLELFKLAPAGGPPLQSLARSELPGREEATRYLLARDDQWWVADTQLARYEIEAEGGRLVPRQITGRLLKFIQPPLLSGSVMYQVRERPGMPGVMVSAVDPQTDEPVWQTWLAASLAGEPLTDAPSGSLTAVTASGGVFRFPPASFQGNAPADQPVLAIEAAKLIRSVQDCTPLGGGRFALTMGSGSRPIVFYDPAEHDKRFRWLVAPEPMASAPLALAGGLLVASATGNVFLLDLQPKESSAGNLAQPFRPSLASVTAWKWLPPQAVGQQAALLCDGDRRLYLVRLQTQPEAALIEVAAATTSTAIVAPPVVVSEAGKLGEAHGAAAAARGVAFLVAGSSVVPFALPDLTEGQPQPLEGRCIWGPRRAGNVVLVATDKHRLYCFGAAQPSAAGQKGLFSPSPGEKPQAAPLAGSAGVNADADTAPKAPAIGRLLWTAALPYGCPVGAPLAANGLIYLAAEGGTIWRISAETGREAGKTESGCPLGTGPVLLDQRLFVATPDGCLLELNRP